MDKQIHKIQKEVNQAKKNLSKLEKMDKVQDKKVEKLRKK